MMEVMSRMRIAIIGGGIAGLAAAYELEQARVTGKPVEYTLYESRDRLGGSLASEVVNGSVLEQGPDSFLTEKPAAIELCRELGIGDALIPSNDGARKTFIVVRNRMVALPDGLMFLVPTKLIPTALTRLFSIPTKIRMGLELLLPPRPAAGDESVAALVKRHFGQEAVDRLADPLLSGIYGGDATQLSAQTVLPMMVKMEAEHGSLCRGMLAAHQKMRAAAKAKPQGSEKRAPRPIFTAIRGGMQQMVDALVARLNPGSIRLNTPISALSHDASGWTVQTADAAERYDSVVVASQAWAAGRMLADVDPELAADLSSVPYSSSITINLVYDETKLGTLPEGFGFLVPAVEGRAMLACTFVHRKFLGRTAAGKLVFRAFLGGMKNDHLLNEPDDKLLATVRRELSEILGPKVFNPGVEPEIAQVSKWNRAMAQYAVGHKEKMARVQTHVAALDGLKLAGNAYDGIGIPDCIRLGRKAAKELVEAAVPVNV
jgi:oxygen-dependent protoporphyrinogen oxidase